MCACVSSKAYMWESEHNFVGFSPSTLMWESDLGCQACIEVFSHWGVLTASHPAFETPACCVGWQTGQWAAGICLLPPPQCWDHSWPDFFCESWGINDRCHQITKLRSSRLHGRHCTDWTVFPIQCEICLTFNLFIRFQVLRWHLSLTHSSQSPLCVLMRPVCSLLDRTELSFGLLHCVWHHKHIVGLSRQL